MKRSRKLWIGTSAAAFAGLAMAATAALAYERAAESPRATVVAEAEEAFPGIDYMITGPVGRTKPRLVDPAISSTQADEPPVRHRMRLK
jgi:hypothetical protein